MAKLDPVLTYARFQHSSTAANYLASRYRTKTVKYQNGLPREAVEYLTLQTCIKEVLVLLPPF